MGNLVAEKSNLHLLIVREWGEKLGTNQEILKCLIQFYGTKNVEIAVIPNEVNIVDFFRNIVLLKNPSRIYVDTRIFIVDASVLSLTKHLADVNIVNRILKSNDIIPVCILLDALQAPGYLLVAELLIHRIGVLIPWGEDSPIRGFSPNSRVEDSFNPISFETATLLKNLAPQKSKDLFLGGLLYEPRKSYIESVVDELHGSEIEIAVLPKKTDSYIDYLSELSKFRIILNTNFVVNSNKKHMVGRNIEALHVGSLLLTQNTPRLKRLFAEGEHYVSIESPSDAATKIRYYLNHQDEAKRISIAGQEQAISYAKESYFIKSIDSKVNELIQGKGI